MVAGKSGLEFLLSKNLFSIHFLPKIPIKHRRNRDKFIYGHKKAKSIQIQKSTLAQIYLFTNFKGKKTCNMNPLIK